MKIAQKISLSFAVIFVLVFTLGATAVLSLRQIYEGVYESLRRDVPAIHESALLGIQLAQSQKDPGAEKILERFSSYVVTDEEKDLLTQIKTAYQQMLQLSEGMKKEEEEWQQSRQQFFKERETVLDQISLLIQSDQKRLEEENDLFLIQSHYLPVVAHLSNYRRRVMDLSSILDQSMIGFFPQQFGSFREASEELTRMQSVLENYVLVPEEQSQYDSLRKGIESLIELAREVLKRHQVRAGTLENIGGIQRQIQGLLIQLIEQERGQIARKTGLGVTFIEDIPATRVASFLGIYASNARTTLERYLLTSDEKDRRQYEQLKLETDKNLDEYNKFLLHRQGGQRQQAIVKKLEEINNDLSARDQQILSYHEEKRKAAEELQKLLRNFESQINEFLAQEAEMAAKKKEVDPVRQEFLPKMKLAVDLLQSVSDSAGNLSRYPVNRESGAKEFYDTKLLEILQNLDRLKAALSEKGKGTGEKLDQLFQEIRGAAAHLIETTDQFWNKTKEKEGLVLSQRKTLLEVLDEEKDKNSLALDQLEKKVVLINGVIIGIVLLIIIGGIAVIIYTTRAITRPIQELSQGAKVIGGGQLNYRIPLETGDELEELAGEFNKMTHELQGLYTNLELKVEQRTRELARANASLAEFNQELDDFTYIVSHDLKEPLRGIDAFSRFVLQDYASKLDPKGKEYLESIQEASKRMTRLIENLLDLSRISRQRNPLESADLAQVLEEVRKNLVYAITEKKVNLQIGPLPTITCDRVRVQQVFHNLISNAIKYNDKNNPVVEIGCAKKDNLYEFYVRDNGVGIPKEYLDKVFKLFQRLPGAEKVEGTGAGLVIVKKIIEKHGGKIWLESEAGSGTVFFFTLPMEPVKLTPQPSMEVM